MSDASPYKPSVATYFPHVPDFARDANGDPIISSLRGPERTEARQQLARERLVAAAEVKILHEQLKWCYFQEGVNHLQNCKDLVTKLAAKIRAPYYGMPGAPSKDY